MSELKPKRVKEKGASVTIEWFRLEQRYNTGWRASLQEEIDFGDDIHQEINTWTQPADGYRGASQGLSPDPRQAIKAKVVVTSSQSVSFVCNNESFWRYFLLSNFHFHGID